MQRFSYFLVCLACISFSTQGQDIYKENLGPEINTPYDESKPLISPDGKTLYFARQNHPNNVKGESDAQDIYFSVFENGKWSAAQNIGEPLNDRHPNGVSSVSPDGNSLLVINAYHITGIAMSGVSISKRIENQWQKPEKINIENFYNLSEYTDYYLSNDERVLLMTIEREDSQGDQDVYVSFKKDESMWSEPVSLGPIINTSSAEFAPFLAGDNKTLFFASQGHDGFGGSDIFYAKRLDDTWQNWSKPVNLGPEVNSDGFEGYYSIPASSDFAYFVSDQGTANGSKDLFKVTLPYKFRPEPVLLVNGQVFDENENKPLAASISYIDIEADEDAGFALSNFDDGAFKIVLKRGTRYHVMAERPGYFGVTQYQDLNNISEYQEIKSDLYLIPLEKDKVIDAHQIVFVDFQASFKPEAYIELDRIALMLRNNPRIKIEIGGHANSYTQATANLKLSEKRANAVKKYLINIGIHQDRLLSLGYGSVKPYEGPQISIRSGADINDRITFQILQTDWFEAAPADSTSNVNKEKPVSTDNEMRK